MPISRSNQSKAIVLIALLVISAGVRLPGLFGRSIWGDEAITLLELSGHANPSWPREPTSADVVKQLFEGTPSLAQITEELRLTDVHPPLYYWGLSLWRQWLGFSLEAARAFSLVCSIGTVLALYLVLQAGGMPYPLIPSVVYALSTGAIYFGHEARAYAFALLFITLGAFFAYLAYGVAPRKKLRAEAYAIIMAVCCGLALHTNYLSFFPVYVILAWFLVSSWPELRAIAIVPPLVTVALGIIELPTLLMHLGAREGQAPGFVGIAAEAQAILRMNLGMIWTSPFNVSHLIKGMAFGGLVMLMGITSAQIFLHWLEMNRKFWILLLGLACAPSLGVLLLDLLFNKQLHEIRYLAFAGPFLAIIVSYGTARLLTVRRYVGVFLLVLLLGIQAVGINWRYEDDRLYGSTSRSLARTISTVSSPSHIVISSGDEFGGRGHPGALSYELDPHTMLAFWGEKSELEALQNHIEGRNDVWIVFSPDHTALTLENTLVNRLQETGQYVEVFRNRRAIHLAKKSATGATWPDTTRPAPSAPTVIQENNPGFSDRP